MGTQSSSIHYRRRWYYVLWSSLLAASICLWILWLVPAKSGEATLRMHVRIGNLPAGSRIGVWVGPRSSWTGKLEAATLAPIPPDGALTLSRTLPVAYRRWFGDYIPGKTADLVILGIQPLEGPVRYISLRLHKDWAAGALRPGRKMLATIDGSWNGLSVIPPRSES